MERERTSGISRPLRPLKENGDMNEVYGRVPLDLCSCKFGRNGDFSVYCSSSFVVLF